MTDDFIDLLLDRFEARASGELSREDLRQELERTFRGGVYLSLLDLLRHPTPALKEALQAASLTAHFPTIKPKGK